MFSGNVNSQGSVFQGSLSAMGNVHIGAVTNITEVRPIARSLYQSFFTSSASSSEYFRQVQNELASLLTTLEHTEETANSQHVDTSCPELHELSRDCCQVIEDLQALKSHFDGVGYKTQVTWRRQNWRAEDYADIRLRITSYVGRLNLFISKVINSSQKRVEEMLQILLDEYRAGTRVGSVASAQTIDSLSTNGRHAWRQLRKELESVGITQVVATTHKQFIVDTLCKAIVEEGLGGDLDIDQSIISDSDSQQSSITVSQIEQNSHSQQRKKQKYINDKNPYRTMMMAAARILYQETANNLHEAAKAGDLNLLKQLLENGDSVNTEHEGLTPLTWAVLHGQDAAVNLLLGAEEELNCKNDQHVTALHMAVINGHEEVAKRVIHAGTNINSKYEWSQTLSTAISRGHEGVVKVLLQKHNVDIDHKKSGITPLLLAVNAGHRSIVKLVLEAGDADINFADCLGQTPLLIAAMHGHYGIVKLLLETSTVDMNTSSPLDCQTPLIGAVDGGHAPVVKLLLETGRVNVNAKDSHNRTPLFLATMRRSEHMVRLLLLTRKADINFKHRGGMGPLDWALECGDVAIAELLRSSGAIQTIK